MARRPPLSITPSLPVSLCSLALPSSLHSFMHLIFWHLCSAFISSPTLLPFLAFFPCLKNQNSASILPSSPRLEQLASFVCPCPWSSNIHALAPLRATTDDAGRQQTPSFHGNLHHSFPSLLWLSLAVGRDGRRRTRSRSLPPAQWKREGWLWRCWMN